MGRNLFNFQRVRGLSAPMVDSVGRSLESERVEYQAIGGFLRRQRELRGVSLAELAELTRIPFRSLERLEAGHFDGHVDGFSRGFVRTVAEALGLDPGDTLARMFSEPEAGARKTDRESFPRRSRLPWAGVAVAMCLGLFLALSGRESAEPMRGPSSIGEKPLPRRNFVRELAAAQSFDRGPNGSVSAGPREPSVWRRAGARARGSDPAFPRAGVD